MQTLKFIFIIPQHKSVFKLETVPLGYVCKGTRAPIPDT